MKSILKKTEASCNYFSFPFFFVLIEQKVNDNGKQKSQINEKKKNIPAGWIQCNDVKLDTRFTKTNLKTLNKNQALIKIPLVKIPLVKIQKTFTPEVMHNFSSF